MALIDLKDVTLAHGGLPVLDSVKLLIAKGERICLMGRNGEGKSTLLRLLHGDIAPDAGEIVRRPGLRVGLLPQEVPARLDGSVRDVVAGGFTRAGLDPTEWEHQHAVEQILTRADLAPDLPFADLSAGVKRRVLLARAMVIEPDLLLLDEPTNHLDINAIAWLEDTLQRFAGTLVFVTHDRAFLRALARRIVEVDRGRLLDWSCDYATFLERRDQAEADERNRQQEFDRKLAQEEVWIRKGIRARRTRNEGRVRALQAMREERRARREKTGTARLELQDAERSGRLVIRVRDLAYRWEEHPIVSGFSTAIMRGDRVGILGPNGSGKTTLLQLLLGELTPQGGTVEYGTKLQIAYYDQQRRQLDESKTVCENVTDGSDSVRVNGQPVHAISYLKNFLFTPDRARSPISHLSGGERNRLLLARLFTRPANLLVLDEPTNDLDLETVELLEELLTEFDGTLLLVSHDREFLDNVTTSTLVLEGDGRIAETVGGYADWARTARRSQAPRSDRPKKPSPRPKSPKPRRLTWKESKELEALPGRIEALEQEQAALHERLAAPDFYQQDGDEVRRVVKRAEDLKAELAEVYQRWQDLEDLAD